MSQIALANAANVSRTTINDFERGAHVPYPDNLAAIVAALEAAGVSFIDGDETAGAGVRLREPWKK
jgi:transcriptional regulator with XRE-family HTH domain